MASKVEVSDAGLATATHTIAEVRRYGNHAFAEVRLSEPDPLKSRYRLVFERNWPRGFWPPRNGDIVEANDKVRLIARKGSYPREGP